MVNEIPGFYYDESRRRYFRLDNSHNAVPDSTKYTKEAVSEARQLDKFKHANNRLQAAAAREKQARARLRAQNSRHKDAASLIHMRSIGRVSECRVEHDCVRNFLAHLDLKCKELTSGHFSNRNIKPVFSEGQYDGFLAQTGAALIKFSNFSTGSQRNDAREYPVYPDGEIEHFANRRLYEWRAKLGLESDSYLFVNPHFICLEDMDLALISFKSEEIDGVLAVPLSNPQISFQPTQEGPHVSPLVTDPSVPADHVHGVIRTEPTLGSLLQIYGHISGLESIAISGSSNHLVLVQSTHAWYLVKLIKGQSQIQYRYSSVAWHSARSKRIASCLFLDQFTVVEACFDGSLSFWKIGTPDSSDQFNWYRSPSKLLEVQALPNISRLQVVNGEALLAFRTDKSIEMLTFDGVECRRAWLYRATRALSQLRNPNPLSAVDLNNGLLLTLFDSMFVLLDLWSGEQYLLPAALKDVATDAGDKVVSFGFASSGHETPLYFHMDSPIILWVGREKGVWWFCSEAPSLG